MNIVVIELIVVAVVALGLGFWQLYDVNRELRKGRDNDCYNNRHNNRDKNRHATADRSQMPVEEVENPQGE